MNHMARRFVELEKRLRQLHPEKIREAEQLARSIVDPRTADAGRVWLVLGDKPLYTNARADVAGGIWVKQFRQVLVDAWNWNQNRWGEVVADPRAHGITFSVGRLCRMRSAAEALRKWDLRSDGAPLRDLADRLAEIDQCVQGARRLSRLEGLLSELRDELGYGWGPATILHALTDLGLACKPDRHVLRTLQHLDPTANVPGSLTFRDAAEVVVVVRDLVRALYGDVTPGCLRYVDKILMEISACGLIGDAAVGIACRSEGAGGRPSGRNAGRNRR